MAEETWWTLETTVRVGTWWVHGLAAVDSGTSYILLPEALYWPFLRQLVPRRAASDARACSVR